MTRTEICSENVPIRNQHLGFIFSPGEGKDLYIPRGGHEGVRDLSQICDKSKNKYMCKILLRYHARSTDSWHQHKYIYMRFWLKTNMPFKTEICHECQTTFYNCENITNSVQFSNRRQKNYRYVSRVCQCVGIPLRLREFNPLSWLSSPYVEQHFLAYLLVRGICKLPYYTYPGNVYLKFL